MADKYSPNSPLVTGFDWYPYADGEYGLSNGSRAISASFISQVDETINNIRPFMRSQGITCRGHIEIAEAGSEIPAGVTFVDYDVTSDPVSDPYPGVSAINGASYKACLSGDRKDDAYLLFGGPDAELFDVQFGLGNTFPDTDRILKVEVHAYSRVYNGSGVFVLLQYNGDEAFNHSKIQLGSWAPPGAGWIEGIVDMGGFRPGTGVPWIPQDIRDIGTTLHTGLRFEVLWFGTGTPHLDALWMRVWYAPENRVAYSYFTIDGTDAVDGKPYFVNLPTVDADTHTVGWNKQAGKIYTASVRLDPARNTVQGGLDMHYMLSDPDFTLPPAGSSIRVVGGAQNLGAIVDPNAQRQFCLSLVRSDGAYSTDSTSYIGINRNPLGVPATNRVFQTFMLESTIAANTPFSQLGFMVGSNGAPTSNITVTIRNAANAVIGTGVITPHDVEIAQPVGGSGAYRAVRATFDPPISLSGGQSYNLTWTSPYGPQVSDYWIIPQMLVCDAAGDAGRHGSPVGLAGSYGGQSQGWGSLYPADTSATATGDYPFTLFQAPPAPTGIDATEGQQDLHAIDIAQCGVDRKLLPDSIHYAALTWVPLTTSQVPAANFDHYEIQREDNFTPGVWLTIAKPSDQNVGFFNDFEARRGVVSNYRLRTVRVDGGRSTWTAEVAATVHAVDCEMLFVSNEQPQLNLAYPDMYEGDTEKTYTFTEADEVTFKQLYGRDFDVAFFPQERRGVSFERTLLCSTGFVPFIAGSDAFAPLRDLSRGVLSYVCVLTSDGGRYFANLRVTDASIREPLHSYIAKVAVREITATPSTPDSKVLAQ